jgi:hypothetical protein
LDNEHKYNDYQNILDKRIKTAKGKLSDIAYKKMNAKKNAKKIIKSGLVASSFPTVIASLAIP